MHGKKITIPLVIIVIGSMLILGALLAALFRPTVSQQATLSSSQADSSAEIARIRPEEAKAAFYSGEATFVDVRAKEFYTESHIPGALSIPLDELQDRLDELNQNDWIILY
jgi:hypothetical protein